MKSVKSILREKIGKQTIFGNLIIEIYSYLMLFKFYVFPIKTIKTIHLQFTNYCNLNCQLCSFVNQKNKQFMSKELLSRFLEEIIVKNKRFEVREINLWSAGESLMHPDFVGMLELMKTCKKKYPLRFPKVKLLTNVMLLNEEISKKILDLDILDWIGFSVDGGSREECEKTRRGCKFDVINRNITNFQKYNKGKVETMINCLNPLNQKLSSSWMSKEFRELLGLVDYYKLNYPINSGDEVTIEYPRGFSFYKTNKHICLALLQSLVVVQNGDVLACCDDFNGSYPLGNLYKKRLSEICKGKIRKKMVLYLLRGKKEQIPLCKNCNRFSVPYKVIRNM